MVKPRGNTGGINLPKSWIGKRVEIELIKDEKDTEKGIFTDS